jgi:hypothetical protein
MPNALVTVSPATADPCRDVPVLATWDDTADDPDVVPGTSITVSHARCAAAGPDAWSLVGEGYGGYVALVHGVRVTIAVDDTRGRDDLAAVARTLHPLNDHQLWRYTGSWPGWTWLLT